MMPGEGDGGRRVGAGWRLALRLGVTGGLLAVLIAKAPHPDELLPDGHLDTLLLIGAAVYGAFLLGGGSVLLSLFLARTIVRPMRMLARAAIRVRLGRDREVVVPRLPDRGDEIGLLARAFSDMTEALRQQIDAVEEIGQVHGGVVRADVALEHLRRADGLAERRRELRGRKEASLPRHRVGGGGAPRAHRSAHRPRAGGRRGEHVIARLHHDRTVRLERGQRCLAARQDTRVGVGVEIGRAHV